MWRLSAAALVLLTAACTGADRPEASPTPSPSTSAAATPSGSEAAGPAGEVLTPPGSGLALGDRAQVSWRPRADVVGVLDVRVDALERAPLKTLAAFSLDRTQRGSSLYYVHGRAANIGASDLAGADIPLYVLDDRDQLIEATPIDAAFDPCASGPLPTPFATGQTVSFCLLYLVPERGALEAVSFRPTQEFDPITWTGDVTPVVEEGR
jgi:hypothetical protein